MSRPDDDRPDRVTGRPLSPRAFRPFGVEAVVLGPPTLQEGLTRREGVGTWRRLTPHAAVYDRVAGSAEPEPEPAPEPRPGREREPISVRVLVATTPGRQRALRVPAVGPRAARVLDAAAAADRLPPAPGWLLLIDEGPGEVWLYVTDEPDPAAALGGFIGRRGRTDFARARRRSRLGGVGSLGVFFGLALSVYAPAMGLGVAGQVVGAVLLVVSLAMLVSARPR